MSSVDPASEETHLDHMNDRSPWVWPAWLFMVIVAATVIEIVARYFVEAPTLWANELTLFVCSIAFLWAGVYVMNATSICGSPLSTISRRTGCSASSMPSTCSA
jgi:TRAP-type C4-dicarboxylate transport system permease small subunit